MTEGTGGPSERGNLVGLRMGDTHEGFRGFPVREGAGGPSERGDLGGLRVRDPRVVGAHPENKSHHEHPISPFIFTPAQVLNLFSKLQNYLK